MSSKKYNIAVLDDDKDLLKDTLEQLKEFNEIQVVVYDQKSSSFIEKVKKSQIDFLLLDIELKDDTKSGIEVAKILKLPVLFLSGKTKDYLESIKDLEMFNEIPVDFILKGSSSHFEKGVKKYIRQLETYLQNTFILLKIKNEGAVKIDVSKIAVITTDKAHGAASGNKVIYFVDRMAAEVADINFSDLKSIGINSSSFIQIHKSILINKSHVKAFKNRKFFINHLNFDGNEIQKEYPLPEEITPQLRRELKESGFMA